ncbi:MAG: hypothetical protein AAB425_08650, partial [Bdellovibrionota bacterium]
FFWAVHGQAELDLLIFKNGRKTGYEFKYNDAPVLTRSMEIAMDSLGLDGLTVVYPGSKTYQIRKGIEAVPLRTLQD